MLEKTHLLKSVTLKYNTKYLNYKYCNRLYLAILLAQNNDPNGKAAYFQCCSFNRAGAFSARVQ